MDPEVQQLVEAIHAAPQRLVLIVSGGGSRTASQLLEVPGASRTVLEAVVPYSEEAMVVLLGGKPDRICSVTTARAMAMAAYCRARRYDQSGNPLLGVACTASLATDRPKRGSHRAHLAVQTDDITETWSVTLEKGSRSRAEEESLVSRLLLNVIGEACGLAEPLALGLLATEEIRTERAAAEPAWRGLLLGEVEAVCQGEDFGVEATADRVLYPGAFHPLHVGHRRMAEVAEEILGQRVQFEISIFNVDKPPLDYVEIQQRIAPFASDEALWLTRLPTFEEKSRLFPGATFVVGSDTLSRIADPRYYHGDEGACGQALERMAARGCRFLVFGRQIAGRWVSLAELELPEVLRGICQEVPEERFREDVCSTDLRGVEEE